MIIDEQLTALQYWLQHFAKQKAITENLKHIGLHFNDSTIPYLNDFFSQIDTLVKNYTQCQTIAIIQQNEHNCCFEATTTALFNLKLVIFIDNVCPCIDNRIDYYILPLHDPKLESPYDKTDLSFVISDSSEKFIKLRFVKSLCDNANMADQIDILFDGVRFNKNSLDVYEHINNAAAVIIECDDNLLSLAQQGARLLANTADKDCYLHSADKYYLMSKLAYPITAKRYSSLTTLISSNRIYLVLGDFIDQRNIDIVNSVKKFLRSKHKCVLIISVSTLTNEKLENFEDSDCFVYLGCPYATYDIILNSNNYRRKIFTLFEVLLAFDIVSYNVYIAVFGLTSLSDLLKSKTIDQQNTEGLYHECIDKSNKISKNILTTLSVTNGISLISNTSRTFGGVGYEKDTDVSNELTINKGLSGIPLKYSSEVHGSSIE